MSRNVEFAMHRIEKNSEKLVLANITELTAVHHYENTPMKYQKILSAERIEIFTRKKNYL